jgi:hypothetical protein
MHGCPFVPVELKVGADVAPWNDQGVTRRDGVGVVDAYR